MTTATREKLTTWLGLLLGVGYIAAGIAGWIADVTDGDGGDLAVWLVLLVGGGLMVLAGVFRMTGWLAVVLVTIGAVAGAMATFWSIITPILALVLVVLVVLRARSSATA